MKRLLIILIFTSVSFLTYAQKKEKIQLDKHTRIELTESITDEQLDTIDVKKKLIINDYTLIGIQYGAGLSMFQFNPKQENERVFLPMNVGITISKYGKMFGYMPYFGFQTGIFYTQDAYQFTYNEEYDYTFKIENSEKAVMDVIEVPALFLFHYDMWNFKIMAQLGCFGGYRLGIERFPGVTGGESKYPNSFAPYEKRIDYGLKGGLGFGLVFDPIEIHIQATYKHSLSSIYEPDYNSEYYYRFAYPAGITVSAGIHFQLTKRSGKTKAELKKEAKKLVYEQEKTDELDNSKGW